MHYSDIDYADIKQMEKNSFPPFQAPMCMIVVLKTMVGKISSTHIFIVIFNTVGLHNIQKSTWALFTPNLLFGNLTVAYIS